MEPRNDDEVVYASITNSHWIIRGDFNALRSMNEKAEGSQRKNSYSDDLNECYNTWNNCSEWGNPIWCQLDRFFVNEA